MKYLILIALSFSLCFAGTKGELQSGTYSVGHNAMLPPFLWQYFCKKADSSKHYTFILSSNKEMRFERLFIPKNCNLFLKSSCLIVGDLSRGNYPDTMKLLRTTAYWIDSGLSTFYSTNVDTSYRSFFDTLKLLGESKFSLFKDPIKRLIANVLIVQ